MRAARAGISVALLALCLAPLAAAGWPAADDSSAEAELARWLERRGGSLPGFALRRACPTCMRGVAASKALQEGDVIIAVPHEAVLQLGPSEGTYPADMARRWLTAMHNDTAHNETWGPYWATQPGPDEVFTLDLMNRAHLDMLQCKELVQQAQMQQGVTEHIYKGTWPDRPEQPMWEVVQQPHIDLATFKYVTHLYGTRAFGWVEESGATKGILVPLAEFINHDDHPNAQRSSNGTHVLVHALQAIQEGEDITINYQPGVIHRPDLSLYIYGFVVPREQPLLAAVDLRDFNPWDAFKQTPLYDSAYDAGGEMATAAEYKRLSARLAALPTTEAEDQALLEGGTVTDWRDRTILQWRVLRKQALRQTLERLAAVLGEDAHVAAADALQQDFATPAGDEETEPELTVHEEL